MALRIYTGARGSKFVADDDGGFGDAVALISRRADAPITSMAREGAAEPLLKQIGKMSQPQLWRCSQNCTADCHGNCNPANRPGQSTHERRNDGVAYRGIRLGGLLATWQRGIDVQRDRVAAFMAEARKEGWVVTQTYPGSPSESQHVNFRKVPKINLWEVKPLKPGNGGPRALLVVRLLNQIQRPGRRDRYVNHPGTHKNLDAGVTEMVKQFQRDHHLKPDGIIGVGTYTLLAGTARRPPSRLDQAGIDFLVAHEGEVLHVYNDPVGFATFGVGHLLHRSKYTAQDVATYGSAEHPLNREKALKMSRDLLDADVAKFERAVVASVPLAWRKSHDRFNAFVSIAFNLGAEVLTAAPPLTSLGQALGGPVNSTTRNRIAAAILLYNKADSPPRVLPGLDARRHHERSLFLRNKG